MTRNEAITEACSIVALVYYSVGNFSFPSDGFCEKCRLKQGNSWPYENDGHVFDFIRQAVLEKLKKDGFKVAEPFDPITGKEK